MGIFFLHGWTWEGPPACSDWQTEPQTPLARIVSQFLSGPAGDSCLIQDEPEAGNGFSHKMSLKGRNGMLGIDHQHGRFGSDEPGADRGISGRQRRGTVCGGGTGRRIRLDGTHTGAASVSRTEQTGKGV